MDKSKSGARKRKLIPVALGVIFVGIVVALTVVFIKTMLSAAPPNKKQIQQITLLQPPPPPPPKVEPPPPEPEPEVEKLPEPEPEPEPVPEASDEPPPSQDLGLDAEGGAGGDGFGLVGKKGGRGLLGGDGGPYAWYASRVQSDIQDLLGERDDIRKKRYSVKVNLWVNGDGAVNKIELVSSSGSSELDNALRSVLRQVTQLRTRPPEDLPQPIRLRIASRM